MVVLLIILIFAVSFVGTLIVRNIAIKKQIIDIPNLRSSHTQPVPRGGGLAIAFAWYLGIVILFISKQIPTYLFEALLWGIPITIMGFIDDLLSVTPKLRISVQVLCSSLAVYCLGGVGVVDLGFAILYDSLVFSIIAVIGIIWFTNLFNFLDGIDGYISAEIIFICLAVFFLLKLILPLYLAAATAGFILLNWQPAKIFMGDVGSTLLGFTIGVFVVYYHNTTESSVIVWIILTSLFWFDATITLFRRMRNHEKLSEAHRKHGYQRIVQSGFSHQKTVVYSLIINFIVMGFAWLAIKFHSLDFVFLAVDVIYLYFVMRLIDKRFPFAGV
jgi:UDP-N-acetylmuramyl pentapeptide phosphotransferase/UDP-N-acetylglucosamine-1-phosphate transferase